MNILYTLLLCLAIGLVQSLIGGTRLLFSLPGYGILAGLGILSALSIRRFGIPPHRGCLLATAIFFAYVLGRALLSPVVYLAWADTFMVLAALVVYLTTACYLTDPRVRLWVLAWLVALALVNIGVSVRQFVGGDNYMLLGLGRSTQYVGRGSGFYICPDHLAGYLEVVGLLSLAMVLWSRTRPWVKVLLGYCVLCCLAGMLLTASRGGFLSLCVGGMTLLVLSLWRVKALAPRSFLVTIFATLAIGLLVVAAGGYAVSKSRGLSERASMLVARDIRFLIWPSAIKEWQQAPAFGTGSSTFLYYGRRFRDPVVQADPINAHNDYLQFLAEYGAVGVAGLLLFLFLHLRWGWVTYRHLSLRPSESRIRPGMTGSNAAAWNIGALAAIAAIAAHSVVDFNLHIPANALLMAFVFGVVANPGREIGNGSVGISRQRLLDLAPRLALPMLGLWLGLAGLPHLPGEYYAEKARVALRDGKDLAGLTFASEGLLRESQNPNLYFYQGEARQVLAEKVPNYTLSQSFLDAAVEPYRAALKLAPDDTRFLLRMGSALTLLGRYDEADPYFQRALIWDPNLAITYAYYGLYLDRRGEFDRARVASRRALTLGVESNTAVSLQELLNRNTPNSLNN